jgi:hypothetical protein
MKSVVWTTALVIAAAGVGCGKSSNTASSGGDAPQTHTITDAGPTSTGSPNETVTQFYDALRSGDETRIEALLTDKARQETAKSGLDIRSPETASLSYQVGEVEYVTAALDGAHVKTLWTETDEQGQALTSEVIWVLRKQSNGWRVAGMATQIAEGQLPLLFDFENPEEMLRNKQEAERLQEEIQRAKNPPGPTTLENDSEAPVQQAARPTETPPTKNLR